jgi:hypothetical protein
MVFSRVREDTNACVKLLFALFGVEDKCSIL